MSKFYQFLSLYLIKNNPNLEDCLILDPLALVISLEIALE